MRSRLGAWLRVPRRTAVLSDESTTELQTIRREILESGLFDPEWYLASYPEVAAAGMDPLDHFARWGVGEGRSPGPLFHPGCYRALNLDVDEARAVPFWHYVRYGSSEGRHVSAVPAGSEHPAARQHPIIASGLFDPGWYRRQYGAFLPSDRDPLVDYVLGGAMAGRHPSPLFDTEQYRTLNADVAMPPANPLLHYLEFGREEGRHRVTVANQDEADAVYGPGLAIPVSQPQGPRLRTAVVIHAYYLDLLPDLLLVAKNVQAPCRAFITVVRPDDVERARVIADEVLPAWIPVEVLLVENRGRNFGPWLSLLAKRLLDDDLLLHLHTKKSLYSGTERASWRSKIVSDLAGSAAVVETVDALFRECSEVGVVASAPGDEVPYWAHHWLKNRWQGEQLLARMGIELDWTDGYGTFPVGGMFWARTEALRPLLELGLTVDDFAPEPTPPDGTLAHAIERVISLVARSEGFETVLHDRERGVWSTSQVPLNIGQYRHVTADIVMAAASDVDLVTVDLFDTVLARPSLSPIAIQHLVGVELAREHPEVTVFLARRLAAESSLRSTLAGTSDVTMAEIYDALPRDEHWTDELVRVAMEHEIATELRVARGRVEVIESLRAVRAVRAQRSVRIVAMSDTYLPRSAIDAILQSVGAHDLFDDVYLSCERRARKDTGELWDLVERSEQVARDRWLHLGDNEHSDVQAAVDRGLRVVHCLNPRTAAQLEGIESRDIAAERCPASELLMGPLLLRHYNTPFMVPLDRPAAMLDDAAEFGFSVAGPICAAFTIWLVQHPMVAHLDRLGFLAREGEILQRLYDRVRVLDPTRLPPSQYVQVSRRATIGAALPLDVVPELLTGGATFSGSLGELITARAGYDPSLLGPLGDVEVQLPDEREELVKLLEGGWRVITEPNLARSELLQRYLAARDFVPGRHLGVVDVGYSATIQRSLQIVLDSPIAGFYFCTFEESDDVRRQGGFAHGCFAHLEDGWSSEHPFLQASLLFEALLCATHGQVVGYRTDGDTVVPIRGDDHRTPEELASLRRCQAGIVAYFDEVLATMGTAVLSESIDPDIGLDPLRMMLGGQWPRPSSLLSLLSVDDEFSGKREIRVASVV